MERQLRIQRADLLTVAECCDRGRAIHIAELRNFEKHKRRDALARSQLKSVGNERIVFVAANFYLIGIVLGIVLAIVDELGFHAGFSDQSI